MYSNTCRREGNSGNGMVKEYMQIGMLYFALGCSKFLHSEAIIKEVLQRRQDIVQLLSFNFAFILR